MQIVCRGMLCGEYDGLLQISQQAECMRLSRMDKFAAFFCLSISICLFSECRHIGDCQCPLLEEPVR